MKYKLLKKIESTDSIPVGSTFETVDNYIHMDNGLIIIDELLIEQGFIEKIEETTKPKWKVGDYVVKLPGKPSKYPNEISYMKISSIENGNLHEQTGEFLYDGLYESCYRDPTEEELSLYFR